MRSSTLSCAALFCFAASLARGAVVINEIHYDAEPKTEFVEFVELHNTGSQAVSLSGWAFSNGIDFTFPAGATIPAGGYLVVSENPAALQAKFGASSLGPYLGNLSSEGEAIALRDSTGRLVDEVEYQLGFPWPTVGVAPGYSIELINPALDNSLGGHWRASVKDGQVAPGTVTLIPKGAAWKYKKATDEASSPATLWRESSYPDANWETGNLPIGYDPSIPMATALNDMRGAYTGVFLRRTFSVEDVSQVGALSLNAMYDDGFKVWINGKPVFNANISAGEVPFNGTAANALEESNYLPISLPEPRSYLVNGQNTIAIQAHNSHISNSSDFYLDLDLVATIGSSNAGPTPGRQNAAFANNAPPAIRQANHTPEQPRSGETVVITAKITDPDSVRSVTLEYQVVTPGSYIELNDIRYQQNWIAVPMSDDGSGRDAAARDDVFSASISASVQSHRNLVRYRISAVDALGATVRAPYSDDPVPNFAYFVYDGVPSWSGAISPSGTPAQQQRVSIAPVEMNRMPIYHLIASRAAVEDATWLSKYTGDAYRWGGTLVYDGKVYDHIRYRARGGVWRYAMTKNMWKFDFNKGHDFEARDNFGRKYKTSWAKLNLGAMIQQGDYQHRGEQGMFESVGFKLFNLAGVESPHSHYIQFRVIDEANEQGTTQYNGDFWGLYLAIEQEDGNFLDEHDLPDGNLYKMESGTGELNNTARTGPLNKEDLNPFLNTYRSGTATDQWWRDNLDLQKYFSYQAIAQGIHHYDICYGKNYFYFRNPETGKWSVHSWDLDLTWADNMYDHGCGGVDDIRSRLFNRPALVLEYRNRVREIRDLLFNTDQAFQVIDEFARIAKGTNSGPSLIEADRRMWDYNPVMTTAPYAGSKAGAGLYYRFPIERSANPQLPSDFNAVPIFMKSYVIYRAGLLDGAARDTLIPAKASLTAPTGKFPINNVVLRSSSYSGSNPFASMKYRVGEITPNPRYGIENKYEIEAVWESQDFSTSTQEITIPAGVLKVGHTYRARVQMKDATGRTSHWSDPVEFVAEESDLAASLQQNVVVAELMYAPTPNSDYEFIELKNISSTETVRLDGAKFTAGIDYIIPANTVLAPGEYLLVTKSSSANNFTAFRQKFGLNESVKVVGPYSGSLANEGETITLKTSADGAIIFQFEYNDGLGWPDGAESSGHSIVFENVADFKKLQDYGPAWKRSSHINGSPGRDNPSPAPSLVLNEIVANVYAGSSPAETNNTDWIEIYNPTSEPISLAGFYLSDSGNDLKKYALPAGTLAPGQWRVFDETLHFHNPITAGFGLSRFGETVYLSYLPGNSEDRVVDAVKFGAQDENTSISRVPDGAGAWRWGPLTPAQANRKNPLEAIISEVMYQPLQPANDPADYSWREYLEIYNPNATPLALTNQYGRWRLSGGVDFVFNQVIQPYSTLVVVKFDPANPASMDAFKAFYQVPATTKFAGPFAGSLANNADRVALEKAYAPDAPQIEPTFILVDELFYASSSPWPVATGGKSLQRTVLENGMSPNHWVAADPNPGSFSPSGNADRDGDGMPDDWERANGTDPAVPDATSDLDGDGASNLHEYRAGTDPREPGSHFKIGVVQSGPAALSLSFQTEANRAYELQVSNDLRSENWALFKRYEPDPNRRTFTESIPAQDPAAYYRVVAK